MLDITTIFYEEDFHHWKLQARSIEKYFDKSSLNSYNIIINSDAEKASQLKDDVKSVIGSLEFLSRASRIHTREEVLRTPMSRSGWMQQQVLKLLCYRVAVADRNLILDAKNHFLFECSIGDFFNKDGRPKTYLVKRNVGTFQREWLKASLEALDVSLDLLDQPAPPTVTPYPILNETLRSLVSYLDEKYGSTEEFFDKKKIPATEFLMIYALILRNFGSASVYFDNTMKRPCTIFKTSPETDEAFRSVLSRAQSDGGSCFSIHRARFGTLKKWQHDEIANIWKSRGLLNDTEIRDMIGVAVDN